jgi:hypothetical protein
MSPDELLATSSGLSSGDAVTSAMFGLSTAVTELSFLSHVFVADSSPLLSLSPSSSQEDALPRLGRITEVAAAVPFTGNTGKEDSCSLGDEGCLPDSGWIEDSSGLKRDTDKSFAEVLSGEDEEPRSSGTSISGSSILATSLGGGGAGPFSREDRFSAPSDSFFVT